MRTEPPDPRLQRWRDRAVLVIGLNLILWGYLLMSWGWPR